MIVSSKGSAAPHSLDGDGANAQGGGGGSSLTAPSAAPNQSTGSVATGDAEHGRHEAATRAEVTVIMVSYNTRELTLIALETLYANAGDVTIDVVLWDNASHDGSAEAVAERFPQARLVASPVNLGFAAANNAAIVGVETEYLLLLNPDTETYPRAVENLLRFARANPQAGIVGGRTLNADGSLNFKSCWNRMTVWSLFCQATGLSKVFDGSRLFNPEAIGGWDRDTVREVDIVVGCLLMIKTDLWRELGGFQEKYFMYGEEADLCLRAAKLGYRPMITPDVEIVHHVGASYTYEEDKIVKVLKGRVTLIRDHWSKLMQPVGIGLMVIGAAVRAARAKIKEPSSSWRRVFARRDEWKRGY